MGNQTGDFQKILNGDLKAFGRLFESLYPGMCCIAYRYLQDETESKDIVQEAFVKWWEKKKDFRELAAMKSWMYITIKNQCLNHIRDRRNDIEFPGVLPDGFDEDFDMQVIEEETIAALYRAIDCLPEQSRKIMKLVVQGKGNHEIAALLGLSVNTVKTLKYKSLDILRRELRGPVLVLLFWLEMQE